MSDLRDQLRVGPAELAWTYNLENLMGETTADAEPLEEIVGQKRAVKAVELGLGMKSPGYNVFVSGSTGTGRKAMVERKLKEYNVEGPIPDDLCYVNNFKNTDQPRLICVPAGKGTEFKHKISSVLETLKKKIPAIFESEEFQSARNEIINTHMGQQKALFKNFENKVQEENFMMVQVQMGPYTRPDLAPVVVGNPMKIDQLESLVEDGKFSAEELERIKEKYKELSQEMEKLFKEARDIDKTIQENLEQLAKDWVGPVINDIIAPLKEEFDNERVAVFLNELEDDVVEHLDRFRPKLGPGQQPPQQQGGEGSPPPPVLMPPDPSQLKDYEVNLLVDNSELDKPPVVFETTPMFRNLFGTIDRIVDRQGLWFSDHRNIKSGSFLRANGGYLVLNARDMLVETGVWPMLKRTLRTGVLEIQTDPYSIFFNTALKPEKIPIKVRVIIIGEPEIYDLIHWHDEDFRSLFKVKADLDSVMPNTDENIEKLIRFAAAICKDEDLLPLNRAGMEAVTRLGVRWAGRKKKISAQFEKIADLIREADLQARKADLKVISESHVRQAHDDSLERVNMIEDKIHEYIEEGILIIDTDGERVGQINGLSVYSLPEFSFGRPSRITAKASMGKAGIVNIERESEMSGHSYDKGVMILEGFLRDRYAQKKPLSLTASITFEQSYGGIDGDSASSTELYALLSALSRTSIDQSIAVTGSVSQHGEIQPIGGVNEKIEGFFRVCKAHGLTGRQGVMIPRRNLGDVNLSPEVMDAINDGTFTIWAVDHVDQGIELLTGMPAGEPDEEGAYPEGSINYLVDERLEALSKGIKEFEAAAEEMGKTDARDGEDSEAIEER